VTLGVILTDQLHSFTAIELGIYVADQRDVQILPEHRLKANLPAIPEHVPGANRLIADLIDLAALVDPNPDREAARDKFRARLVRNPDRRVHYAAIEFEPRVQKNGDVHAEASYSFIPDEVLVDKGTDHERVETVTGIRSRRIVPFYYTGPEFLKPIENGKFISGGTFHCILFRPETKNGPYKALPLGMADPKTIATYNDVARRRNELPGFKHDSWPIITVIEHELRRPGVRRVRFVPRFDLHRNLVTGLAKRQLLGCHFGQPVYLAPRSVVPEPDRQNGTLGFFEKHLFRVKRLTEKFIEVVWLGKASDITIEERITIEDVRVEMNPFAVLNVTPMNVNWNTIDQSTLKWVNGSRAYNDTNPIYLAARELGLVHVSDDAILIRAHLEQLWKEAVRLVRAEMIAASNIARQQLMKTLNKPTETEIRGLQKSYKTLLLDLNTPTDAVATWMSRALDRPFDPNSPFHMHLREWFIRTHVEEFPQTPEHHERIDLPPPLPNNTVQVTQEIQIISLDQETLILDQDDLTQHLNQTLTSDETGEDRDHSERFEKPRLAAMRNAIYNVDQDGTEHHGRMFAKTGSITSLWGWGKDVFTDVFPGKSKN